MNSFERSVPFSWRNSLSVSVTRELSRFIFAALYVVRLVRISSQKNRAVFYIIYLLFYLKYRAAFKGGSERFDGSKNGAEHIIGSVQNEHIYL